MKVLVTGGAGYIGSILITHLLKEDYDVTCLDRFFFGDEYLKELSQKNNLTLIKDDIRWFNPDILNGMDVVLDLAAISDDPKNELDPVLTFDINQFGRFRVANLSKRHGVQKYILASSMSVYGFQSKPIDENSKISPISIYAQSHANVEKDVLPLNDDTFSVTSLRFSTVYGLSPRMRFDLAVNSMALNIYKNGKIPLRGGGKQWRPFIHLNDVAMAYQKIIETERELVAGQIFNVGSNEQNLQIDQLAKMIGDSIGIPYEIEEYGTVDKRSYIGNFDKIKQKLGFTTTLTPKKGASEVYAALKNNLVTDSLASRTIIWYKHLIEMQQSLNKILIKNTLL